MKATFGDRFKALRNEKGLKQEELVTDFNNKYHYSFTRSAISQYENDKRIPEIDALKNFAKYFNVSVDYLLGNIDIRSINSITQPDFVYYDSEGHPIIGELKLNGKDMKDIEKATENFLKGLEGGAMLNGEILDEEDFELFKQAVKNGLTYAKISNKKKYTPKKYRKNND